MTKVHEAAKRQQLDVGFRHRDIWDGNIMVEPRTCNFITLIDWDEAFRFSTMNDHGKRSRVDQAVARQDHQDVFIKTLKVPYRFSTAAIEAYKAGTISKQRYSSYSIFDPFLFYSKPICR